MEVPATAISSDSLEVRYGIILDGPFALPSGYRLASPVVYVWSDHSKVTKSLKLHIPHWIAGNHGRLKEGVAFVISPHVLPEGEMMYTFTPMEPKCTLLHDTFGTVELSGHCSLIGQAMGEEIPSSYCASAWEKVDKNKHYLKVAIVYCIPFWLEVGGVHVMCCAWILLYIADVVVNASVRFSLNIGNHGPTVVVMKPVQNLKSMKRKLLAN